MLEKTVLVISDKPEQFDPAITRLRGDGYRVRFETAHRRSVSLARTEPPRLIISELAVPDIDGLELCIKIRENGGSVTTPILLVGDLSKECSIVSDAMRCGATGYLQRPFEDLHLLELCSTMAGLDACDRSRERDENLFDALIENISDALTIIDSEGIILYGSPSARKILEYDEADLLGACMFDRVHPADARNVREYYDWVRMNTVVTGPVEYRFRQNDGTWKLIHSIGRPVEDVRFGRAIVITSREKALHGVAFHGSEEWLAVRDYFATFAAWEVDRMLLSDN